jgi:protein SERAC1
LSKATSKSTSKLKLVESRENIVVLEREPDLDVFWPLDLLPESCPSIRVLTWGCHTIVTGGKLPRNQNDIFAHGEDLLQELTLIRDETNSAGRPLIFVTHSLGGVIVKEVCQNSLANRRLLIMLNWQVLRRAEADSESNMRDILPSTSAIMFIASPHRASEHGKLSDAVRSMASLTLQVNASDPMLLDLTGANGFELELGREAFIRMWNDYNFKVKTFQERLPLKLKTPEAKTEFAVRREASFIGEPREQAESLDGDHLNICKFASADEKDYKAFIAALSIFIHDEVSRAHQLSHKEKECLNALSPPGLSFKETQPTASYPGTCLWLYDIPAFRAWHHRQNGSKNKILWIKGRPGSGKTILLKSLRNRVEKQWSANGSAFIWSVAEGRDLESIFFLPTQSRQHAPNPAGVYRSLLGQLFKQDPRLRKAMLAMHKRNKLSLQPLDDAQIVSFFLDDYIDQKIETPTKRTFIFVDAADDCGVLYLQDLVYYLVQMAQNSDFSICIASNHHLDIKQENVIEVVMKEHNGDDILRYINLNLIAEWEDRNVTVNQIAAKAKGVFLWAEMVVNMLNAAIEEGAMQDLIEDTIAELPSEIEGLYEWILSTLSLEEKEDTLILMQWVILASEPLRLNDLRVAIRLTKAWSPDKDKPYMALDVEPAASIRDLRKPGSSAFDTPYQFHRWIRSRSVGLLELKPEAKDGVIHEPLGLQRVQVIHESVRTFFLTGRGFPCLAGEKAARLGEFSDVSHYALLRACLTYLNMADFESLGKGSLAVAPMPYEESKYWRKNVHDQRNLVMSSYPFLQYAVDNVLFHLLSPRYFRYFLPQKELVRAFSANRCRIWRRWTALLGEADPKTILDGCLSAEDLLSPVYGARYRLERIFQKLNNISAMEAIGSAPRTPATPKSPMSISDKWFWPLSPRDVRDAREGRDGSLKTLSTSTGHSMSGLSSIKTPLTPMSAGSEKANAWPMSPQ